MNHRGHREKRKKERTQREEDVGKEFNYKEWIDAGIYVNIWNEQSKDVSWCLVCNLVCFVYGKIGVNGYVV